MDIVAAAASIDFAPASSVPPTDNSDLPSYQSREYQAQIDNWIFVGDMYQGATVWYHPVRGLSDEAKAKLYLPQETAEPPSEYPLRVARSKFEKLFGDGVDAFAGLLGEVQLSEDAAQSIKDCEDNVDLIGSSLSSFYKAADIAALRDGWVGILTERPAMPDWVVDATTELQAAAQRRPYWCLIDCRDVLSWKVSVTGGVYVIEQLVIRETTDIPVGKFGSKKETHYRIYTRTAPQTPTEKAQVICEVVKLVESKTAGKSVWNQEEVKPPYTLSLDYIPFLSYSLTGRIPFAAQPPLLTLAELNLKHLRLSSEYYEGIHKCCMPTPVREGLLMPGMNIKEQLAQLPDGVVGPNTIIDLPTGGKFYYAEPTGNGIPMAHQAIKDVENAASNVTLNTTTDARANGSNKTATQVNHESSKTKSSLLALAEQKESNIEILFRTWANYLGQEYGGTATVRKDLLRAPITLADVIAARAAGDISLQSALEKFQELGIIESAEEEMERIALELTTQTKKPMLIAGTDPTESEAPGQDESMGNYAG